MPVALIVQSSSGLIVKAIVNAAAVTLGTVARFLLDQRSWEFGLASLECLNGICHYEIMLLIGRRQFSSVILVGI